MHYPLPLHLQPALARLGYRRGEFPVTEQWANDLLSLPMFPELEPERDRDGQRGNRELRSYCSLGRWTTNDLSVSARLRDLSLVQRVFSRTICSGVLQMSHKSKRHRPTSHVGDIHLHGLEPSGIAPLRSLARAR